MKPCLHVSFPLSVRVSTTVEVKTSSCRWDCLHNRCSTTDHIFQFSAPVHNIKGDNKHGNLFSQTELSSPNHLYDPPGGRRREASATASSQTASFPVCSGGKCAEHNIECPFVTLITAQKGQQISPFSSRNAFILEKKKPSRKMRHHQCTRGHICTGKMNRQQA